MRRTIPFLLLMLLSLGAALPALDIRSFKSGRNFVTEGSLDRVDWYQKGIATMSDYSTYNLWAVKGLDGKDPVSALWWESLLDYQFKAPDIMLIKYRLTLPWPIGVIPGQARFQIDESELPMDILRMIMLDKPIGVEQAVLYIAAIDSPTYPDQKMVQFRVAMRFDPFVELLINQNDFNRHMREVVSILAANLENYCRQNQ